MALWLGRECQHHRRADGAPWGRRDCNVWGPSPLRVNSRDRIPAASLPSLFHDSYIIDEDLTGAVGRLYLQIQQNFTILRVFPAEFEKRAVGAIRSHGVGLATDRFLAMTLPLRAVTGTMPSRS